MKNKNKFLGIAMLGLIVASFTQMQAQSYLNGIGFLPESALLTQSSDSLIELGPVGSVPIPACTRHRCCLE